MALSGLALASAGHALIAILAIAQLAAPALAAEEDKDLDLIPQTVQQAPPPAAQPPARQTGGAFRNYVENALSGTAPRYNLAVPLPPPAPESWEDRLFFDMRDEWRLGDQVTLNYSGRLNLRAASDLPFPTHHDVRNDLREAFVSWQPATRTWLDLGRINLKNGVAVGYNPTDFFRTRAVVEPLTADPSVLREDRVGTLMLLGQQVWEGGSMTAAFAPKVAQPTAIYTNLGLPSFDPMFDRTNAQHRFLVKGSMTVADGISPELLLYHAGNRTQFGTNLTFGLGQQTVLYAEWAGGVRSSLLDDALRYGRQTGTLPAHAPPVIPDDPTRRFQNDLAAGLSWTLASARLTINAEYHYHEAGFSPRDWNNWFAASPRSGAIPGVNAALWYIRAYAQDQQEPISRHTAFLRADWVDAFVPDLEITGLASIDLQDGSALLQATADYYLSRTWTIGGLASASIGGRRSDYGTIPQAASLLLRVVRYF